MGAGCRGHAGLHLSVGHGGTVGPGALTGPLQQSQLGLEMSRDVWNLLGKIDCMKKHQEYPRTLYTPPKRTVMGMWCIVFMTSFITQPIISNSQGTDRQLWQCSFEPDGPVEAGALLLSERPIGAQEEICHLYNANSSAMLWMVYGYLEEWMLPCLVDSCCICWIVSVEWNEKQ